MLRFIDWGLIVLEKKQVYCQKIDFSMFKPVDVWEKKIDGVIEKKKM
jgi:hypothetical protein